jgi:hypothetical protein
LVRMVTRAVWVTLRQSGLATLLPHAQLCEASHSPRSGEVLTCRCTPTLPVHRFNLSSSSTCRAHFVRCPTWEAWEAAAGVFPLTVNNRQITGVTLYDPKLPRSAVIKGAFFRIRAETAVSVHAMTILSHCDEMEHARDAAASPRTATYDDGADVRMKRSSSFHCVTGTCPERP